MLDLLKAYSRARRKLWARLNGGDAVAKLPPEDPRHVEHARIMDKLRQGILRAIRKNQR